MERRRTPPPEARAPRVADAPNSLQATPLAGGVRPHSHHAESKQRPRPTSFAPRFTGRETPRIANNAAVRRNIHVRRTVQTHNNDVPSVGRRGVPESAPLSPGKRKRPTDPLGLPSLMSPGTLPTNDVSQQQHRSPPKGNTTARIPPNDDGASADTTDSFRNAETTALKCVDHASRRQSAAKAALTATAQISSSLKDLVGDSNRAAYLARQSRIEAENAAVRAEGAAKRVQEASDLASRDRQRASLEVEEANAQAEEAWEFLRQVKGSRKGRKSMEEKMDQMRKPETTRVPPARIGTVVEVSGDGQGTAMSIMAHNPASPRRKAAAALTNYGPKKQRNGSTPPRHAPSDDCPPAQLAIPLQFSGDASSMQASLKDPIRRFKGHTSPVTQIAAVDKNRFISSSWDTTIRMWNASTGECMRTFRGHRDWVHAVTVLDSQHFISGSDDRTVKLWNVDEEECLRTFKGHTSFVKALAPMDGDRFLSGSRDRTIKLFSTAREECLQTFQGHTDVISAIVPLDSHHFASGSHDNDINYWDVASASCVRTLSGHTGAIKTLASVSDIQILSGSDDKTIRLWDVSTGYCFREFGAKTALVFSVTYICEGFFLACGGNHIKLYHIPSGTCVKSYETPRISLAVVRLDDERFVTGSDAMIHLWKF
ncbi:hypothetical protein ACHAXT_000596 [Thalassiosira profunda]